MSVAGEVGRTSSVYGSAPVLQYGPGVTVWSGCRGRSVWPPIEWPRHYLFGDNGTQRSTTSRFTPVEVGLPVVYCGVKDDNLGRAGS